MTIAPSIFHHRFSPLMPSSSGRVHSHSKTSSNYYWLPAIGGEVTNRSSYLGEAWNDLNDGIYSKETDIASFFPIDIDWLGNGWGGAVSYVNGTAIGTIYSGWSVWTQLADEHCHVVDGYPGASSWDQPVSAISVDAPYLREQGDANETYSRTADTFYHLRTGGRAVPGRQNLWCFTGGAEELLGKRWTPPYYLGIPRRGIPVTQVMMGELGKLKADGKLWVALPNDVDKNITPTVDGKDFYTFGVGAQKYSMQPIYLKMGGDGSHQIMRDNGSSGDYYNCVLDSKGNVVTKYPILYESTGVNLLGMNIPVHMEASPTFRVYSTGGDPVVIHGKVSGTPIPCNFWQTNTPNSQPTWTTSIQADSALTPSLVDYYQPLTIEWKIYSPDRSVHVDVGTTKCPVYVSLKPPKTGDLYHTVVHLACSVRGATTEADALAHTWGQFSGKSVQTWDEKPLYYYNESAAKCTVDLAGLLSPISVYQYDNDQGWNWRNIHDGNCDAFVYLLQASLQVNGMDASIVTVLPPSGSGHFVVKNANFTHMDSYPSDFPYNMTQTPTGIKGQNKTTPEVKDFKNHKIIVSFVDEKYYDPSYGVSASNPSDYINSAIDGIDDGHNHWKTDVSGMQILGYNQ